jgi:hypothetical protein
MDWLFAQNKSVVITLARTGVAANSDILLSVNGGASAVLQTFKLTIGKEYTGL